MRPTFGAGYTGVVPDVEQPRPNTEDRTLGELATDVAIDTFAKPLVGAMRTGAQMWRTAETTPEAMEPLGMNTERGWGTAVEKGLGWAEEKLNEARSDRARALDTLSADPGPDERSFWREPVAGAIHQALPSVGYGLAAWATGGSSILAQVGTAALMGATGAGEAVNELRNFTDNTDIKELNKLPMFQDLKRRFSGDEQAARDQMFKDLLDPKSQIFNFFVNAANFPAFKHGLRTPGVAKAMGDRLKAAGYGALEGAVLGAGETGTEAYIEQLAKVRTGEQQAIDTGEITSGIMKGLPFGAPMAAFHAIAPPHYKRPATPLGTDEQAVADQQINQQGGPAAAAPAQPGGPGGPAAPAPAEPVELEQPPVQSPPEQPQARPTIQDYDMVRPHPEAYARGIAPDVRGAHTIFKTAKGSEYFLFDDGTTVRNKAPRREHGEDFGWKDRTEQTFYITPEHANYLGGRFQAEQYLGDELIRKRIITTPRGMTGMQYLNGASQGKVEQDTYRKFSREPQVGLIPVELWHGGQMVHFGNPITEVHRKFESAGPPGEQPPEQPVEPEQYGPPTEPFGPDVPEGIYRQRSWRPAEQDEFTPQTQPRPQLSGRMTWSNHEQGFTVPVRVLDRPATFENGRWVQEVAYTNPQTGRTQVFAAPLDELQEQAGPLGATPREPPVREPQQPLPPQFPEVEQPGLPTPEDFGETSFPPETEMAQGNFDLVRGGAALWSRDTRQQVADQLTEIAKSRAPTMKDIPGNLRSDLDKRQYKAFEEGLRDFPQDVIDTIRQSPEGLATSPVLQDLRVRMKQRSQQQSEADREKLRQEGLQEQARRRGQRPVPRADRTNTQAERDLIDDIIHFQGLPPTRKLRSAWNELNIRAKQLDYARQRAGLQPLGFVDMLGPQPPSVSQQRKNLAASRAKQADQGAQRRAEVQQQVQKAKQRRADVQERIKERKEREARLAPREAEARETAEAKAERERKQRSEDIARQEMQLPKDEVLTAAEQKLHKDVADFNKRVQAALESEHHTSIAEERKLEAERAELERRVAPFNASAEERGLERLDVGAMYRVRRPPETSKRKRLDAAANAIISKLQTMLENDKLTNRPETRALVRQLEHIAYERTRATRTPEQRAETRSVPRVTDYEYEVTRRAVPPRDRPTAIRPQFMVTEHEGKVRRFGRQDITVGENVPSRVLARERLGPLVFDDAKYGALFDKLVDLHLIQSGTQLRTSAPGAQAKADAKLQGEADEARLQRDALRNVVVGLMERELAARRRGQRGRGRKATRIVKHEPLRLRRGAKEQERLGAHAEAARRREEKDLAARLRKKIGKWTSLISKQDRDRWNALPKDEQKRLRSTAVEDRVTVQRDIEEIIRDEIARREEEARQRALRNKPPTQFSYVTIPTPEAGVKKYRELQAAEKAKQEQQAATGSLGQGGTRGKQYADRDQTIKETIENAIKHRIGSNQRFLNLLTRVIRRSGIYTTKSGERRPISLVRQPKMPGDAFRASRGRWTMDRGNILYGMPHEIRQHDRAIKQWEEDTNAWIRGTANKVGAAHELKVFLEHLLERIEADLEAKKKATTRGKGSIGTGWSLPERVWDDRRNVYTFRAGKIDPGNSWYNFASDLQKIDEALRQMEVGLGTRLPEQGVVSIKRQDKASRGRKLAVGLTSQADEALLGPQPLSRPVGYREQKAKLEKRDKNLKPVPLDRRMRDAAPGRTRPGVQHAVAPQTIQTYVQEFGKYTSVLGRTIDDFAQNFDLMLRGPEGVSLVDDKRKQRSEEYYGRQGLARGQQEIAQQMGEAELGTDTGKRGEARYDRDVGELGDASMAEAAVEEGELPGSERALQTGEYGAPRIAGSEAAEATAGLSAIQRETRAADVARKSMEEIEAEQAFEAAKLGRSEEISGGSLAATQGVNAPERRTVDLIERKQQERRDWVKKELEKRGLRSDENMIDRVIHGNARRIADQIPIKWTPESLRKKAKPGILGMGPTRDQSVAARVAHLPAPADGMTRLYRVEADVAADPNTPDWLKDHAEHVGRWFASDPTTLDWYVNHIGGPTRITYIDVPSGRADKMRVDNHPNSAELRKYSRVPEQEHFVSRDIADRARPAEIRTMAAPSSRVQWQTLRRRARSSLSGGKDIEVATNPDMATIRQIIDGSDYKSATVIRDPETRTIWAANRDDVMHAELMDALQMRGKETQLEFREFSLIDGRVVETDVPRFGKRGVNPIDEMDTTDEQRQARMMRTPREISRWLEQDHLDIGGFDESGLPADRIGPRQAPYTAEEQRYVDAADQLYGWGEPTSDMIMSAETTTDLMDRVQTMLAEEQLPGVAREYVTDEFLHKLAAITPQSKVYHAPYDAVSGLEVAPNGSPIAPAFYRSNDGRIVMSHDISNELYASAALHETGHAALFHLYETDEQFAKDIDDLFWQAQRQLASEGYVRGIDELPPKFWGMTNPHEFMSEIISNQGFRDWLDPQPMPSKPVISGFRGILNAVYRAIRDAFRRVMGIKDGDTALDVLFYDQSTVLGEADKIIKRNIRRLYDEGSPPVFDPSNRVLGMGLTDGARAFRDGVGNMFGRAGFQLKQIATENRAPGMMWRTMHDITKIGGPAFKAMMADLFETLELKEGAATKLRDADNREINDLARIWSSWNKEGRKAAGELMIDEGMHTAWLDAPLGERAESYREDGELKLGKRIGKNAHIEATRNADGSYTADNLRDEQVVHQHQALQERMAAVEKMLPPINAVGKKRGHGGYKEFRERVYAFAAKRAEEVRRNDIRNVWAVSDIVPQDVKGAAREQLLDTLEKWTDTERKLSPADLKVLDDAGMSPMRAGKTRDAMMGVRDMINEAKEFSRIVGPYSPFTRYGDWALSGKINIDRPKNAIILNEDIDEATGELANDARYVFESAQETREFIRDTTDKFGIAQMDGGKVWIDTRTGQRPRVPDARHTGKERLASEAEIARYSQPGGKRRDPEWAKRLDPKHMKQYYYAVFQPKLLTMEPDQYTAQQNMQAWMEDPRYKGKISITKPMDVFRHDGRQNEHYVGNTLQRVLNYVRAQEVYQKLDKDEQAGLTRQWNLAGEKYTMRRGFMQRQLPRNYVLGPTTHVLASLDEYSSTSSNYIAKSGYGAQLKEQQEKIGDYLKEHEYEQGDRNFVAQKRAFEAIKRRIHNPTRNPHETFVTRNVDRMMRATVIDKLPTVGYFVVNGVETPVIGGPLMFGRHGALSVGGKILKYYGIAGTFTRFRKAAMNDIAKAWRRDPNMTNFIDLFSDAVDAGAKKGKVKFAAGLKDVLQRAANRGIFDVSASLEYQSSFPTSRKPIDVALDFGQGLFQALNTAIENNGRFVTLGSAYELEMERLLRVAENPKLREHNPGERQYTPEQRHKAASDYAIDIAHQANGVYANYNAPEIFTREGPLGALGPIVFQFKKWPQRITMIYMRSGLSLLKGVFGDWAKGRPMSPENREGARQFVGMIAMVGLAAGALGLPTEPFSVLTNAAFMTGLSPYNWDDVEAGFRQWVGKHGGKEMAQLVAHGPLSYLTGMDWSGRMSQADMWAFGSPASNKTRDIYASMMGLFGGASLSSLAEIKQGVQSAVEGMRAYSAGADDVAYKKGSEFLKHIVPIRLWADAISSLSGAEGTELSSGRMLGKPYTPFQRVIRAAGFTPTPESEAREARSAITSLEKRMGAERKRYVDMFASSPVGAQRERVWQTIQESWNPYHPGMEITQSELLKAANTRKKAKNEPREQLGITQNRNTRALMPMANMYGI